MRNLYKIYFWLETTYKAWKYVCNTICEVSNEFQAPNSQKRSKWIFKNSMTPARYAKKLKKLEIYAKFFFGSKQPKKLWNTSATPFVKFPMNFRPITLKKELSDLSEKMHDPGMQKNSIYTKFIFGLKQPKKLENTSPTSFVKFHCNK